MRAKVRKTKNASVRKDEVVWSWADCVKNDDSTNCGRSHRMKTTRKPLEVEYVRMVGVDKIQGLEPVLEFMKMSGCSRVAVELFSSTDFKSLRTKLGDYVVRLPDGRVESLTPEEFEREYEVEK